jgi:hypothetical protein
VLIGIQQGHVTPTDELCVHLEHDQFIPPVAAQVIAQRKPGQDRSGLARRHNRAAGAGQQGGEPQGGGQRSEGGHSKKLKIEKLTGCPVK